MTPRRPFHSSAVAALAWRVLFVALLAAGSAANAWAETDGRAPVPAEQTAAAEAAEEEASASGADAERRAGATAGDPRPAAAADARRSARRGAPPTPPPER